MRCLKISIVLTASTAAGLGPAAVADIPPHPDQLEFPDLDFTPPRASDFREELPDGVPLYMAPSHELPLVTIAFSFRGGHYLDPADRTGLGVALGRLLREGGTTSIPPDEFDERVDFLAANISSTVGRETSSVSLNCLASTVEEAFSLFMDMVRNPGFDEDRLRVYVDEALVELGQRNDQPMRVAMLNAQKLLYGTDHHAGRFATKASVESITPDDLRALHGRIVHPGNMIVAVSGDFDREAMRAMLAGALEEWPIGEPAPDPPAPTHVSVPGLYHAVSSQEDLPQGTTLIVTRTIPRDHPDAIALTVMNHILGGGGFTSRIMSRVRSDEGLAYAAGSFLQPAVHYPGVFLSFFMSKNSSVARAASIVFDEIGRIRDEPVTDAELALAANALVEALPQRFASRSAVLGVLVNDELTGRDPEYWQQYRDRVRGVTVDDVTRVARQYLVPDDMLMVVVGPWEAIRGGDGRAAMDEFFDGVVHHLPRRDPLTLEPVDGR